MLLSIGSYKNDRCFHTSDKRDASYSVRINQTRLDVANVLRLNQVRGVKTNNDLRLVPVEAGAVELTGAARQSLGRSPRGQMRQFLSRLRESAAIKIC